MAQDIEFISGYKNYSPYAYTDGVNLDMTEHFRGVADGAKIDYAYFNSNSNNTTFRNRSIYTTYTDRETPDVYINIDDVYQYKVTRADLHANFDANRWYTLLAVKVGWRYDRIDPTIHHNYQLECQISFDSKDGNEPGSIDHFRYRYGLVGDDGYTNYFENLDFGYMNPTVGYDPFFMFGIGYVRIDDVTVPEDRRVLFGMGGFAFRPSATYPYPYFPMKQTFREITSATITTCTPYTSPAMYGSEGAQYLDYIWQFLDLPKAIGVLNLTPTLELREDYSPEVGPASEEEPFDGASHDDSSDTIDIPTEPTIGVTDVGFVNVYKTGSNSLQNMGVELFPPLSYTPPAAITAQDTTGAIINGFNSLVTFFANIPSMFDQIMANTLINYVIDCHMIPVTPSANSSPENIKVGYKTLQTTGYKVTSDYKDVDCGSISLSEYYAGFADFLENVKLYLPFVGFVSARPEWFKRTSLQVKYRFNIIDGSFVAYVLSSGRYVNNNNTGKTIVGQYAGNACVHLPITGVTYSTMVAGLVGAGSGAVAAAGSGNIAAAATSAIAAAGAHGDISQSNSYNSSASFMGCRRPFLLIERPVSNYSKTYQKELGIPSNVSKKLSSVTGFTMVGDVHLDGITATDKEKLEIERLLHEGVIL